MQVKNARLTSQLTCSRKQLLKNNVKQPNICRPISSYCMFFPRAFASSNNERYIATTEKQRH
jgi:hypothetical protein